MRADDMCASVAAMHAEPLDFPLKSNRRYVAPVVRRAAAVVLVSCVALIPRVASCERHSAAYLQMPRSFEFPSNPHQVSSSFPSVRKENLENVFNCQKEKFERFAKQAEGFVFGALGGASGTAAMYPAEATKMRMQAAGGRVQGFLPTIRNTMHTEGVAGLYKGLQSTLMGVAPEKAIMIGLNQALRKSTSSHQDAQGRLPIGLEVLCGSLSGLGQVLFSSPKEMIMVQMQLASQRASAVGSSLAAHAPATPLSIIKNLGVGGLYQGASATALREVPFAAIYFTAYSQIKGALLERTERETLPFLETLACATAAAAPAAFFTTPADVVKTRMQAQAGQAARLSLGQTARQILRKEGPRAFFVGATPRVIMKAPQLGIALLVVETLTALANPPPAPQTA